METYEYMHIGVCVYICIIVTRGLIDMWSTLDVLHFCGLNSETQPLTNQSLKTEGTGRLSGSEPPRYLPAKRGT